MRPKSLCILLALAFAGVACDPPKRPLSDKLVHLDLRLADGSSSARKLAGGAVRWVERLEIAGPQSDLGSWSTQYCRVDPVAKGGQGVSLRGIVPDGERMKRVELRSSKTFKANEIDFVELELANTTAGIARVAWRSSEDAGEIGEFPRSSTTIVPFLQGSTTLRISLATQPGWTGDITELSIAPKESGVQRVDVIAVRLGRIGFMPGPDALETDESDATPGLDGGLIALGREARRAVPVDWNVPLFARAHVPRGGRLAVEVCVSTNTINLTAEVHFCIDAREKASDPWQRVGFTKIVPGERSMGPAWEHVTSPLPAFWDKQVELRFLANDQGEPNEDGSLERARAYWGEALIFGEQPRERRPNVLLITLDTVRADAIGALRAARGPSPTPFLDSLAARGILFEQAWSACNATSPSHASLMTGLAIQDHGLTDNRSVLAAENQTLAESFRAAGWQTAAAVSVAHLTPGNSGLGQGFDRFWLAQQDSASDGARTTSAVRDWWRAFAREGPRPIFLWLHLFDAHTPYDVPQWFLEDYAKRVGIKVPPRGVTPATLSPNPFSEPGQFLVGVTNRAWPEFMYQACVAYEDELLRQLFSELVPGGNLDNTFVAVVADHGEALGEHENFYHHTGLYREVMHVPMIIVAPGGPRGLRVKQPAWSLDLSRTLFGLCSGPLPTNLRGTDLLEFAARADRPVRRIFFEHSDLVQSGCADEEHSAIYTRLEYMQLGRERKIAPGTLQLFDIKSDPGELLDIAADSPELDSEYRELFKQWESSALKRERLRRELSAEDELRLKQLGY